MSSPLHSYSSDLPSDSHSHSAAAAASAAAGSDWSYSSLDYPSLYSRPPAADHSASHSHPSLPFDSDYYSSSSRVPGSYVFPPSPTSAAGPSLPAESFSSADYPYSDTSAAPYASYSGASPSDYPCHDYSHLAAYSSVDSPSHDSQSELAFHSHSHQAATAPVHAHEDYTYSSDHYRGDSDSLSAAANQFATMQEHNTINQTQQYQYQQQQQQQQQYQPQQQQPQYSYHHSSASGSGMDVAGDSIPPSAAPAAAVIPLELLRSLLTQLGSIGQSSFAAPVYSDSSSSSYPSSSLLGRDSGSSSVPSAHSANQFPSPSFSAAAALALSSSTLPSVSPYSAPRASAPLLSSPDYSALDRLFSAAQSELVNQLLSGPPTAAVESLLPQLASLLRQPRPPSQPLSQSLSQPPSSASAPFSLPSSLPVSSSYSSSPLIRPSSRELIRELSSSRPDSFSGLNPPRRPSLDSATSNSPLSTAANQPLAFQNELQQLLLATAAPVSAAVPASASAVSSSPVFVPARPHTVQSFYSDLAPSFSLAPPSVSPLKRSRSVSPPRSLVNSHSQSAFPLPFGSLPDRWRCPFDCGKVYRTSSSRSILKHIQSCTKRGAEANSFNLTPAGGDPLALQPAAAQALSESLLPLLAFGKRKQKRRRKSSELLESERWNCPRGCGAFFRSTSTRSIYKHKLACGAGPEQANANPLAEAEADNRPRSNSALARLEESNESESPTNAMLSAGESGAPTVPVEATPAIPDGRPGSASPLIPALISLSFQSPDSGSATLSAAPRSSVEFDSFPEIIEEEEENALDIEVANAQQNA